jgi:predicted RNA binding protein with dsRBD fold (UPF0201 family)
VLVVHVETVCRPTESVAKVKTALLNLFPDMAFDREDDVVAGTATSLQKLRELIRNQKIRDTARGQFLAGRRGGVTRIALSKQAALMGVVNFSTGPPLGDIVVELESDDFAGVIDFVAESTVERTARPSARTEGM